MCSFPDESRLRRRGREDEEALEGIDADMGSMLGSARAERQSALSPLLSFRL